LTQKAAGVTTIMGSEIPSTNNVKEELRFGIQEYDSTYSPSYETFGATDKKDKTKKRNNQKNGGRYFRRSPASQID